jgi:hypothetical protein
MARRAKSSAKSARKAELGSPLKGEERMADAANAASELEQKSKVIAHLTLTLASTRECLELAVPLLSASRMKAARTSAL